MNQQNINRFFINNVINDHFIGFYYISSFYESIKKEKGNYQITGLGFKLKGLLSIAR